MKTETLIRLLKPHTHNNRAFKPGRVLKVSTAIAGTLVRDGIAESAHQPVAPPPPLAPRRGGRARKPSPTPTPTEPTP